MEETGEILTEVLHRWRRGSCGGGPRRPGYGGRFASCDWRIRRRGAEGLEAGLHPEAVADWRAARPRAGPTWPHSHMRAPPLRARLIINIRVSGEL